MDYSINLPAILVLQAYMCNVLMGLGMGVVNLNFELSCPISPNSYLGCPV